MSIFKRNFLSMLSACSLLEISFSCESIGMLDELDKSQGEISRKMPEKKAQEEKSRKDFAKIFLERLSSLEGKPLKDNKTPYVDVNHREDTIWINQQGKRIIIESQ